MQKREDIWQRSISDPRMFVAGFLAKPLDPDPVSIAPYMRDILRFLDDQYHLSISFSTAPHALHIFTASMTSQVPDTCQEAREWLTGYFCRRGCYENGSYKVFFLRREKALMFHGILALAFPSCPPQLNVAHKRGRVCYRFRFHHPRISLDGISFGSYRFEIRRKSYLISRLLSASGDDSVLAYLDNGVAARVRAGVQQGDKISQDDILEFLPRYVQEFNAGAYQLRLEIQKSFAEARRLLAKASV